MSDKNRQIYKVTAVIIDGEDSKFIFEKTYVAAGVQDAQLRAAWDIPEGDRTAPHKTRLIVSVIA